MGERMTGDDMRNGLEPDQPVLLARRRARQQLDTIAAQCPGHKITVEIYPGRRDRYVAQADTRTARPYLLITTDLNELSAELCGPAEHSKVTPLPPRAHGTSWTPPHSV
jgi:hypothetical protein